MTTLKSHIPYALLSLVAIVILITAIILYPPTLDIIGCTVAGIIVFAFVIVTIIKITDKALSYL